MAGFKKIKIFTDTNIIHTAQSHLLVSTSVSSYISEHKKIESVELKWYLPSMVLEERRHQMINAAIGLNPKLQELEKLLGHSLGISEEIMSERVDAKIKKIVSELGLKICDLETNKVDWDELIQRSVERRPPFEISNNKEKGFRDAIIATSFLQEVERSPITPRSCLLVFVSGDKRIREYIQEKLSDSTNIRLLEDLDDLKSFLNAIGSEVTEEFLKEVLPKANLAFYDFDTREGLYTDENISKIIIETYLEELNSVASSSEWETRNETGTTISQPTFIEKKGQTIVWSVSVFHAFDVVKTIFNNIGERKKLGELIPETKIIKSGRSQFAVTWQHQVSTKGKVSRLKLNKIEFVEHIIDIPF